MNRWLLTWFGTAALACSFVEALGIQGIPLPRPAPSLPRGVPTGREFVFRFPPQIAAERCEIKSHQAGQFGGWGGPPQPADPGTNARAIRTGFDNQPARTLKAAVWCPGFAMALIDVPSLEQSSWQITVAPEALRNIPLAGRVVPPAAGVSLSGATLRVYYSADWLCSFFGLADCLVPTWEAATSRIADDGTFSAMVPDFMNDPSVRPAAGWPAGKGYFTLRADRPEAPWSFWLSPSGASLDRLPVASQYPSLVMNASRR